MINIDLLREEINNSGMTITAIAQKTNISRETLHNKISGRSEFTATEISAVTNVLRLTREKRDMIFFGAEVE